MFDIAGTVDTCAAELAEVLGAVAILSPVAFAFNGGPPVDVASAAAPGMWAQGMWGQGMWGQGAWGEPSGAPPQGASGEPDGRNPDAALMHALQNALYDGCYAHRLGEPRAAPATTLADDPAFAQELARANAGSERWEPGWVIQQLAPNGQAFVRKGERERIAVPGAFISAIAPGMVAQPGSSVLLRAPAGALGVQPGYYFAFGETLEELAEQLSLVRFYFHCAADDAAPLLGALTSRLNRFQIPFQMKLPSAPALYGRTDAAVLYLAVRYVPIVLRIVGEVRATIPLDTPVPLFAKPLWPGIATAFDPANGESFGSHRCRLTAEGLVDAWHEGRQDGPARRAAVAARFAAAGLDLARPWLGPGCIDPFRPPHAERG